VDAVIVGSGAGGAPVAYGLARAGYRVIVLEKGPAYDQRDFTNDEIANCRYRRSTPSRALGYLEADWLTPELVPQVAG